MTAEQILAAVAVALFMGAVIWLYIVMARESVWWLVLPFVTFGLALVYFCVTRRKQVRVPLLLLGVSVATSFGALAISGDLITNRHPEEPPGRTFWQRAFGCTGTELWSQMIDYKDRDNPEKVIQFVSMEDSLPDDPIASLYRKSVRASAIAYLDHKDEKLSELARFTALPSSKVRHIKSGESNVIVLVNSELLLIAFRGTNDAEDWVKNVNFIPVSTSWGHVHSGFQNALDDVWVDLLATVREYRTTNQPVVVTGHSLGGAMAILASLRLASVGLPPDLTVTFGQPPVGYESFSRGFDLAAPLIRFVNHRDVVPEVQTPFLVAPLTHVGERRYFDTSGELHHDGPSHIQGLRDSVCAPLYEPGAEFNAHKVLRYVALLHRR